MKYSSDSELKKAVLDFLGSQPTLVFSSMNEGEPHSATMRFHVDDDLCFYLFSLKDTRKVRGLTENKKVSLVTGFGPDNVTVQVGGDAAIESTVENDLFWDVVKSDDRFTNWPPAMLSAMADEKGDFVIIKVTPRWISFLNLDVAGHPESYFHDFQSLEA